MAKLHGEELARFMTAFESGKTDREIGSLFGKGDDWSRYTRRIMGLKSKRVGNMPACGTQPVEAPRKTAQAPEDSDRYDIPNGTWEASRSFGERIETPDQLLKHLNYDQNEWEVEFMQCKKWDVVGKQPATSSGNGLWTRTSDEYIVTPVFHVHVKFRRRKHELALSKFIDALIIRAENHAPHYPQITRKPSSPCLAAFGVPDAHFAKFAWGEECWHGENYDIHIASNLYQDAVDTLLRKIARHEPERIVFRVGDDLFHVDNLVGTTTGGTPQDFDTRPGKVFEMVEQSVIRAIDQCLTIAPVYVLMIPGNHDNYTLPILGRVLKAWYRNCPDVVVDCGPEQKKYFQYGCTLIGNCHGDTRTKAVEMALKMPVDEPDMWAETDFHEIHVGHLHKEKTEADDISGVKIRTMQSISAADRWHTKMGYTGTVRGAMAFIYDRDLGPSAIEFYNVPRTRNRKPSPKLG